MSTLRRVVLTDRNVAALKPVKGKRVDVYDALMPKLLLRVTDSGSKTYCSGLFSGRERRVAPRTRQARRDDG